ncbi:hypothetical protein QTP86_023134, partial [Hemibagrus guttatus]
VMEMIGRKAHGFQIEAISGGLSIDLPPLIERNEILNNRAGSRGQQSKQGCPDFPLPRHFLQLFRRDPEAFPGQPRDIVSAACPGSEHLPRETSRRHPKQMPEPPQLSPFDVEELRLYYEPLLGDRALYPISKGALRHPTEEAHFGRLNPRSYPFSHDPELMTIGESRNVD